LQDDRLIRDLNNTLIRLTGELGEVKSTLKLYEKSIENINLQISVLSKNINQNNITIARATGFVGGISFITSTVTAVILHYLKII